MRKRDMRLRAGSRPARPVPDWGPRMSADTDASALVRRFLAAMEARDLPTAEAMLAPGFVMRFPGTGEMTTLAQLIDWAAPRYRFVKKTYDADEAIPGPVAVVYCRGTLSGEWPDGTPFDGIRFIDRFEVEAGRITRQDVWNDIAETKAAT